MLFGFLLAVGKAVGLDSSEGMEGDFAVKYIGLVVTTGASFVSDMFVGVKLTVGNRVGVLTKIDDGPLLGLLLSDGELVGHELGLTNTLGMPEGAKLGIKVVVCCNVGSVDD